MILQFIGKKRFRDEGILQLVFLLSLLRGNHDHALYREDSTLPRILERDLSFGSSLGHMRLPHSLFLQETHPKSLDRVLLNYQQSVLNDLNALGDYSSHLGSFRDIHAYLLNAESSLSSPSTPEEGGYVSGPPSPEAANQNSFIPNIYDSLEENYVAELDRENDLLFEDLELFEALYKQDVDIGVPREVFDGDIPEDLEKEQKLDIILPISSTKDKDHGKEPDSSTEIEETLPKDDHLTTLNFTVDSETGELLLANENCEDDGLPNGKVRSPVLGYGGPSTPPLSDAASNFRFEFNLDEALKLVELNSTDPESESTLIQRDSEADSGCGESPSSDSGSNSTVSLDALNDSLDDMIQASQLHSHHPRAMQGRLGGLVRSGSMEQRWQDLASLLSLPSPDPAHHAQSPPTPTMASHATSPIHSHSHSHSHPHPPAALPPTAVHHPHPLYPTHHEAPPGSVGSAPSPGIHPRGGVLLHNSIQPAMAEQPSHNITYSNSMGASSHLVATSMNLTNSSELSDADHHYKMETSSTMPQDIVYYQQQNAPTEMNQTTDGFFSSFLNDEDLQIMDIPMPDYGNRGNGEYNVNSYRCEDPQRLPQGAQKKHHMFGKRFFQENPHASAGSILPPNHNVSGVGVGVSPVPVVGPYHHSHYPQTPQAMPMEGATALDPEMKYSCSTDFRATPVSGAAAIDNNVHHNHTYHVSPEGPSGITRSMHRDKKGKKSESQRHLTRDEKKAESLRLPISCEDIINLPMDEFNERISKHDLTESQLSLIRDIRRRGKNKVAAQNCRKRKLDQIIHLAEEVKIIQSEKNVLTSQQDQLRSERERVGHKFSLLYKHIFQSLRDADGNPYSPHEYSLQESADRSILLVPKSFPPPSAHPHPHPMDHIKSRHSREPTP